MKNIQVFLVFFRRFFFCFSRSLCFVDCLGATKRRRFLVRILPLSTNKSCGCCDQNNGHSTKEKELKCQSNGFGEGAFAGGLDTSLDNILLILTVSPHPIASSNRWFLFDDGSADRSGEKPRNVTVRLTFVTSTKPCPNYDSLDTKYLYHLPLFSLSKKHKSRERDPKVHPDVQYSTVKPSCPPQFDIEFILPTGET